LKKKFWKIIVVEMDKIQVQSHGFNTEPELGRKVEIGNKGSDKILSKWTKYELRASLGAKRIPWSCYEAQEV
jgi:hypothetical protein